MLHNQKRHWFGYNYLSELIGGVDVCKGKGPAVIVKIMSYRHVIMKKILAKTKKQLHISSVSEKVSDLYSCEGANKHR